jgi:hypothetical protein
LKRSRKNKKWKNVTHADVEWKRLKVIVETVEQAVGYQPKPVNREWFDDECKTAVEEKNIS